MAKNSLYSILAFYFFCMHINIVVADEVIEGAPSIDVEATDNISASEIIELKEEASENILSGNEKKEVNEDEDSDADEDEDEEFVSKHFSDDFVGEYLDSRDADKQALKIGNDPNNNDTLINESEIKLEEKSIDVPIGMGTPKEQLIAVATLKKDEKENFYSFDYLKNMYLPFFYHTYELPQSLNSYLTLRGVHLDKSENGEPSLVYEIGVADSKGPMDLEGDPKTNKFLYLFCKIALNDSILHKVPSISLEFYHGDTEFFENTLTYNLCTGEDVANVDPKISVAENKRLDEEFIYAYEQQKDSYLSYDYLVNKFAPYALKRIVENFNEYEKNPRVLIENGDESDKKSSVVFLFSISNQDFKNIINKENFDENRVSRTCAITAYEKWILPRVEKLVYRYEAKDNKQKLLKEILIYQNSCHKAE
ncbi:MAG: hypothetical protein ACI4V7_01780 [Succinivibrionaceae bacterium]